MLGMSLTLPSTAEKAVDLGRKRRRSMAGIGVRSKDAIGIASGSQPGGSVG